MKKRYLIGLFSLVLFIYSCSRPSPQITNPEDYEIYLSAEGEEQLSSIRANHNFWVDKLEKTPKQFPYLVKIAGSFTQLFEETGNIEYLAAAQEKLITANEKTQNNNAGYLRSLARNYISQHKFKEALLLLEKAELNGENLKATQKMLFDVHLELGNEMEAEEYLAKIKKLNDLDFLIRYSKWNDHKGDLDKAIVYMEKAVVKAESQQNNYLKQWAYTNLADFYGHKGRIKESYEFYLKSLELDPSDAYSKKGIAWIAYSHDRNPKEALRILHSINSNYNTPDLYLFKAEIAEYISDFDTKTKNLNAYFSEVNNKLYGDMYNAYNVLLYAEELEQADMALKIAKLEVKNRPTAKSYDLLAWAYYHQGKTAKAMEIMEAHVTNKTFDPEALFHMATIYKAMGNISEKNKLKNELLTSTFELGLVMEQKINML